MIATGAALGGAVALLLAALHDLAVRTVPNALIGVVAACGLAGALAGQRCGPTLLAAACLAAGSAALWRRGCLGGADAKLLGAAGLLVPPASVPLMLAATAIAGGVLCLPYLPGDRWVGRPAPGRPGTVRARLLRCERWRLGRRGPLPYAAAIAAGTIWTLWRGA